MPLVPAWGNSRGFCQAPGGPHAPTGALADPHFLLSGWHCEDEYSLPGDWHVGGIGMGWGECPEFVCLREGQGVSREFMIHHRLSWGIFTPWL